jgi:hypothetical protein
LFRLNHRSAIKITQRFLFYCKNLFFSFKKNPAITSARLLTRPGRKKELVRQNAGGAGKRRGDESVRSVFEIIPKKRFVLAVFQGYIINRKLNCPLDAVELTNPQHKDNFAYGNHTAEEQAG